MTHAEPSHAQMSHPDLAVFGSIVPAEIAPALTQAIAIHREAVETICSGSVRSFETVLRAKEAADLALHHAWSPVSHLSRVANTPALRQAHADAETALSSHGLWVSQNRALYDAMIASDVLETDRPWSDVERCLRSAALRDFELSGVALEGETRERYRAIALELTQLSTEFGNAVLDATEAFQLHVRRSAALEGIPPNAIARFRAAAEAANLPGWLIGLQDPDVQAVLTYADSRWLRRKIYHASATRASDEGPHAGQFDNSERIERILELRHEMATLLDFPTSAHRSLATKMASSPQAVEDFLLDLGRAARDAAMLDMANICEVAANDLGIRHVRPWDIAYISEMIRRRRFAFDAEAVRAYFPADRVTEGAMTLIDRLFGVRFVERNDVSVWHEDARFYDVVDQEGATIAGIYIDLFARQGKQGGAWMDVCRQRYDGPEGTWLPIAFLTCNFAGASGTGTATLRHGEVVTLLHEFGHVLHHILTEVDFPSIGGINGVEWDAVEVPSQLMENFAWDYDALALFSGHIDNGEILPRELFERMLASRNFQAGMRLCRQIELALLDLRLHRDYDPARGARALEILAQVRSEVAVTGTQPWVRLPHAFSHIFAGAYAAGYYSYLWAELLSADAFGRFCEAGGLCASTGRAWRREVLARGATRAAAENFTAFRGREADPQALLRSYGLAA